MVEASGSTELFRVELTRELLGASFDAEPIWPNMAII